MRINEILNEDYQGDLETDLNNLIISVHAANATSIPTQKLVAKMNDMGYSVDINSLSSLLQRNQLVSNVSPTEVNFNSNTATPNQRNDDRDSEEKVSQLAQKANSLT